MTEQNKEISVDQYAASLAAQNFVKGAMIKGLSLKLLAFIAAIVSTVGLLTFFWFDGLAPYRWWMIIGGSVAAVLFGWCGDKYQNQLRAIKEMGAEEFLTNVAADAERNMDGQYNASR